jgi:hypothetical protein
MPLGGMSSAFSRFPEKNVKKGNAKISKFFVKKAKRCVTLKA